MQISLHRTLHDQLRIHILLPTLVALVPVIAHHIRNQTALLANISRRNRSREKSRPLTRLPFRLIGNCDQFVFQIFVPSNQGTVLTKSRERIELLVKGNRINCVNLSFPFLLRLVCVEIFIPVTLEAEIATLAPIRLLRVKVLNAAAALNRRDCEARPISETADS